MARKRLAAPFGGDPPVPPDGQPADPPAPARPEGGGARMPGPAPIARVAGDAAVAAALDELAGQMAAARAEGRLAEALPLDRVEADHLVRDRIALDAAEMEALVESLRRHGQRVPVEVVDLGGGRYGLISGWRRLTALRRLSQEEGERFGHVLAFLRRPDAAGDAYVAMVEENEIRAGLSYYERARIAARAVEAGAFPDRTAALRALYATASRAKRSKIGSFMSLVDALDGVLRFPAAIPERLGLSLAERLAEPALAARLAADLESRPARDAGEEAARLSAILAAPKAPSSGSGPAPVEVAPGLRLIAGRGRVTIAGAGVDAEFRARLEAWLRGG